MTPTALPRLLVLVLAPLAMAGCAMFGMPSITGASVERECLARAMYFESNRSSREGMLAVGTVVMNRVADPNEYPRTVCGVVGQKNQFAEGVLTRPMNGTGAALATEVAGRVLAGERHRHVGQAKHFHMAGLRFPYGNMHYVHEAGGNEFYVRTARRR